MRPRRTPTLLLVPAAVVALALGCDSGRPKEPQAKIKPRETIGKKAQDVYRLEDELDKGAVLASTEISVSDPLTQAAEGYRTSVGKIGAMAVEQAIQLRNAQSISDPKPLTYEEFMAEIFKKGQPDQLQLAQLPYYQEYAWDEKAQKLVVIEYPEKKAAFEKQKPY